MGQIIIFTVFTTKVAFKETYCISIVKIWHATDAPRHVEVFSVQENVLEPSERGDIDDFFLAIILRPARRHTEKMWKIFVRESNFDAS